MQHTSIFDSKSDVAWHLWDKHFVTGLLHEVTLI